MKKVLLFLVAFGCFLTQTQSQTKKEMDKWFNEKAWLGGVQLKPHKTINKQELYRQYHANKSYWDKVFAFLRDNDLKNLSAGRHEIDGDNAYAMVTVAPTKDFDSTHWESHRNYIDVQYVIDGKELIGVHPVAKSTVSKPYNSETDLINYTAKGKTYTATPETFFIFFPTDAHRPGITPGGNETDKKLVIKVKVAK
jgi:YhcH/YjgK/YiaL family protein